MRLGSLRCICKIWQYICLLMMEASAMRDAVLNRLAAHVDWEAEGAQALTLERV